MVYIKKGRPLKGTLKYPEKPTRSKKIKCTAIKVFQDVLLRKNKHLLYCFLDCPFHLQHHSALILDNDEKWHFLDTFATLKLITEKEVKQTMKGFSSKKLFKVKSGGSYDISIFYINEETLKKRLEK